MADNIVEQITEVAQPAVTPEVAQAMAISLNGGILPQEQSPVITETSAPTVETVTAEPVVETTAPLVSTDSFALLKEKFGYASIEDTVREIEELRRIKNEGEITFENKESEALLKAIIAGKNEEVWDFLDKQRRIDGLLNTEITESSAADVVKLGMQLKYKDLTPQEIEYRFNKQFGVTPKPVKGEFEEDLDYQQRVNVWEAQVQDKKMELMIEAKLAKPDLVSAKSNIVLPNIEEPIDEGYATYKKNMEQQALEDKEVLAAYKSLLASQLETKISFNDEPNKIAFEFQFIPDADSFAKAVNIVSDHEQFWNLFKHPDGSPNRTKFLDTVYYAMNKEKVLTEAMKQAKNATIKATLPDNSAGSDRQLTQPVEENELDKLMRASLKGYGGF